MPLTPQFSRFGQPRDHVATQTKLRSTAVIALALLIACGAATAERRLPCEVLSAADVEAITGDTVHSPSNPTILTDHPRASCRFTGKRIVVVISVIHTQSQEAAAEEFLHELRRPAHGTQSDEWLPGVGVEARYRPSTESQGGTIIARFGTAVVVLTGNLDRPALVRMARAVAAHL